MSEKAYDTCGSNRKRNAGKCNRPSGWGTDHPGQGRCKLHGGSTPIKSGRYSKITRPALRERIERFESDPDPTNLLPEVALLRAFTEDLIERFDEIYGEDGALLAWHESFKIDPNAPGKPRQMPDFSALSQIVDRVGAMVDRIQKWKAEGSITLETLNRVLQQFGSELVLAVNEIGLDEPTSSKLLNSVEQRWAAIKLEPVKSGNKRITSGESEDSQ